MLSRDGKRNWASLSPFAVLSRLLLTSKSWPMLYCAFLCTFTSFKMFTVLRASYDFNANNIYCRFKKLQRCSVIWRLRENVPFRDKWDWRRLNKPSDMLIANNNLPTTSAFEQKNSSKSVYYFGSYVATDRYRHAKLKSTLIALGVYNSYNANFNFHSQRGQYMNSRQIILLIQYVYIPTYIISI